MLETHDAVANERLTLSNNFGLGEYSGCALPISDEAIIPPAWAQMAASAVPSEKLLGSVAGAGPNDSSMSSLSVARPGTGAPGGLSSLSPIAPSTPPHSGSGSGAVLVTPAGSSENQQGDTSEPNRSALMLADFEVQTIEPEPGGVQLTVLTFTRQSDTVTLVCLYFFYKHILPSVFYCSPLKRKHLRSTECTCSITLINVAMWLLRQSAHMHRSDASISSMTLIAAAGCYN